MPVRFDQFYKYDELTSILKAWAAEQPDRFRLSSALVHESGDKQ